MAQRRLPAAQQVQVAERVTFPDGHRTVAGYVARKGRTYAHVVTDEGTEVRVPYRGLSRDLGTSRKYVQSHTDTLRAQWHAGNQVRFAVGTETLSTHHLTRLPANLRLRCDALVLQTLMMALCMRVNQV